MSSTIGSRVGLALQAIIAIAAVSTVIITARTQRVAIVELPSSEELAARRDSLEREAMQLRESLRVLDQRRAELNEAIQALSDSLQGARPSSAQRDLWLITVFKTFAVSVVLAFSIGLTPFAAAADIIALLFGAWFPILNVLWSFSWDTVTMDWYWNRATPLGVILGMVLVLGGDGASVRRSTQATRKKRRTKRVV